MGVGTGEGRERRVFLFQDHDDCLQQWEARPSAECERGQGRGKGQFEMLTE